MNSEIAKPTMHIMGGPKTDNERLATQIASILEKRNGGMQAHWDGADHSTIAKDAAKIAVQAATSTKGYWQMASSEIAEHRGALDATNFAVKQVERKLASMQSDISSNRNTCILWGIGAGLVSAIAVSMMFGPSTPSAPAVNITNTAPHQVRLGAGG